MIRMKPASSIVGDVAGHVPAVAHDLGGLLGLAEIAEHPVRTVDEQQPFPTEQRPFAGRGSTIFAATPGSGWPTVSGRVPRWRSPSVVDVGRVDGHDRRHLGAAVALEQVDAELLLERRRDRFAQLLGADDRVAQVRELLAPRTCGRRTPQKVGVLMIIVAAIASPPARRWSWRPSDSGGRRRRSR